MRKIAVVKSEREKTRKHEEGGLSRREKWRREGEETWRQEKISKQKKGSKEKAGKA